MAQRPRVEELSDSDPEEMDPSDFDTSAGSNGSLISPSDIPVSTQDLPLRPNQSAIDQQNRVKSKRWQCLYPVYFDAGRTRAEGRRVSKELAVPNPLAREIVDAVTELSLNLVFDPGKTHPKDWANPGRVRVLVKEEGRLVARTVDSSEWDPAHHTASLD